MSEPVHISEAVRQWWGGLQKPAKPTGPWRTCCECGARKRASEMVRGTVTGWMCREHEIEFQSKERTPV